MQYSLDQAFTKGIEFHKIGMFDKADYFYKKALKIEPNHGYANHNSGTLCLDIGNIKEALFFFQTALKTNPNDIQFWISYIDVLIRSKNYVEADKFFKRAKELGANGKNFEDLEIKLLEVNSTDFNSNKIKNEGDPSKEKLKHIYEHFHNKNYRASLEGASNLLDNFPNSILLYNLIGTLFHKLKMFEDALANYRIAIKLSPVIPEILINLGNVHRDLKNFDEALICFRDALELKPNISEAFNSIGLTYKEKNDFNLSIVNFNKAIKLEPNNYMFHNNLGELLTLMGEVDKAFQSYQKSMLIYPNFDQAIMISEFLLKEKKDAKNALKFLENVLIEKPMDVRANAYKYITLRGLGRFSDAEKLVDFSKLVYQDNFKNYTNQKISDFNYKLLSALELHPRRMEELDERGWAIRGGTVIRKLFTNPEPIIKTFEILLRRTIDKRINDLVINSNNPFLIKKPKHYKLNCWANFLKAGDYQSNHIHNLGWMSGVYYVDLPELENENVENEGFIEFNRAGYGLPHFGKEEGIKLIKPETGMIIFFPSYVWHGTIPFSGSKNRVSISFDISFS